MKQAELILKGVSEKTGIPVEKIVSKSRANSLVTARLNASIQMRACGMTLSEIGNALNRDHSAITHLLNHRKEDSTRHKRNQEQPLKNDLSLSNLLELAKTEKEILEKRLKAINDVISLYKTK